MGGADGEDKEGEDQKEQVIMIFFNLNEEGREGER